MTPAGVAAFARATPSRLLVVETVCASLAAGALVCLLATAWFPVVREAIRKLPDQGVIRNGELTAPRLAPAILAENTLFAISVNPESRRRSTSVADVRVEFGKRECRIDGLLGALVFRYPRTWTFEFNRHDLEPWWGAWELMILGLAALLTVVSLLLLWALLGALYCWVPRALAFFADRQLSWAGSWRLASAALLPGALLMTLALLLYSLGLLDLVRFGIVAALHLVVGWVYLVLGALALAKAPVAEATAENPFVKS